MRAAAIGALAALAGCATIAGPGAFQLTADQMNGAWTIAFAQEQAEAEAEGLYPLWNPQFPLFSGATCRWVERDRAARCRYRASRGMYRRGSARHWVEEDSYLYLRDGRWTFGG